MIIFRRDGRTFAVKGWRAWLLYGVAALIAALVFIFVISLLLGLALTVVTFVIFGLPLAVLLALIVRPFWPRQPLRDPRIIDHEPLPPRSGGR